MGDGLQSMIDAVYAIWRIWVDFELATCGLDYVVDTNEATKSGDDPFKTLKRVAMLALPVLAGLLLKFRDNYKLLSETLDKRIGYSKVVGSS
jgi:hypothetical protein